MTFQALLEIPWAVHAARILWLLRSVSGTLFEHFKIKSEVQRNPTAHDFMGNTYHCWWQHDWGVRPHVHDIHLENFEPKTSAAA